MPPPEIQLSKKKKKRAGEEDERAQTGAAAAPGPASADAAIPGMDAAKAAKKGKETDISKLIDSIDDVPAAKPFGSGGANAIVEFKGEAGSIVPETKKRYNFSAQIIPRLASKWPKPEWRAPWKLYRVISGHLGWVRSVTVDPSNEWFATGSADRTIKIWDLASGQLKLTLTGHIEQVMGIAVSDRHPYMFSCGLDKMVKCWDLEYNKVIRHYHGHLSGVYSLALHPALDVLMTGGRDSACRVWDMRTKTQVFCLSGHDNTVGSIVAQENNPQVITGSYDSTVKLWDLAAGKCAETLTYHKKGVRALALHPREFTLLSASADNIKKFGLPHGKFMHNMLSQQKSIVNSLSVNEDDVVVSGGDNGSLYFWDYKSGHNFQQAAPKVQPGSIASRRSCKPPTWSSLRRTTRARATSRGPRSRHARTSKKMPPRWRSKHVPVCQSILLLPAPRPRPGRLVGTAGAHPCRAEFLRHACTAHAAPDLARAGGATLAGAVPRGHAVDDHGIGPSADRALT